MVSPCCSHTRSAGRVFSIFAGRYSRRFRRRGFERSQEQLLAGLAAAGYRGDELLEIGSGVGYLHQTLLERGARSAVGVDLAPKMLAEARKRASRQGLTARTRYIEGDFVELEEHVAPADVVLMDKVVCCYPDADTLVHAGMRKCRRVYALTCPRDRWFVRLAMGASTLFFRIVGSGFRPYLHDPQRIEAWIADGGFRKSFHDTTPMWLTLVYVRP